MHRVIQLVLTTACIAAAVPHKAQAGEVVIGNGKPYFETCHSIVFVGVSDQVAKYRAMMAERFEKPDQTLIDQTTSARAVAVLAAFRAGSLDCARNSGEPRKIVLTERGSPDALLSIDLTTTPLPLANAMGAQFIAYNGSGTVHEDALKPFIGRELEIHLVYEGRPNFRDKWKKDHAAKVLAPR